MFPIDDRIRRLLNQPNLFSHRIRKKQAISYASEGCVGTCPHISPKGRKRDKNGTEKGKGRPFLRPGQSPPSLAHSMTSFVTAILKCHDISRDDDRAGNGVIVTSCPVIGSDYRSHLRSQAMFMIIQRDPPASVSSYAVQNGVPTDVNLLHV